MLLTKQFKYEIKSRLRTQSVPDVYNVEQCMLFYINTNNILYIYKFSMVNQT